MRERVAAYIEVMGEIPGWCRPVDIAMFDLIDRVQERAGVTGDILEIGVFRGKSACFLGSLPRGDERLVVNDLFEDDAADEANRDENRANYASPSQRAFERNYRRLHSGLPRIVRGPSSSLPEHVRPGSCRLVHVDGSHLYDVVLDDLDLALELGTDDVTIVFDDIHDPHTPGVAAAAWSAITAGRVVPVAVTPYKLTVARTAEAAAPLVEALRADASFVGREHTVAGHVLLDVDLAPDEVPLRPRHRRVGRHLRHAWRELRA